MAPLPPDGFLSLLRQVHFVAVITWIGILYYLNFVQTSFLATELAGQARGFMLRGMVPNVPWWFRWGATITFLRGWSIVITKFAVGGSSMAYHAGILTGGLLGSLMWYDLWFAIMPRHRLAIANATDVAAGKPADPAAAAAAPIAGRASRTNKLLSLLILLFMGAASHLALASRVEPNVQVYIAAVLVLAALFEANVSSGNATTQKPLTTVTGTIHTGLGLRAVL